MEKHAYRLKGVAFKRLKRYKAKWIPANETQNLIHVHEKYTTKIPAIKYRDIYIGVTNLKFCKWEKPIGRKPEETPFTEQGRDCHFQRTKKKRRIARQDRMYNPITSELIVSKHWGKHYNFEFYMNRAYALNRDRLKCRVCGGWLISCVPYAHHINPKLPQNKVNTVNNLASMHRDCLEAVNKKNADLSQFDAKARRKIESFRERLGYSHVKTTI